MRIHELAKEVGKTSKELIALATALKISAKSHMSVLSEDEVAKLKKSLSSATASEKPKKSKAVEKEKEVTPAKKAPKTAAKQTAPKIEKTEKEVTPSPTVPKEESAASVVKEDLSADAKTKKVAKKSSQEISDMIKQRIAAKLQSADPVKLKTFVRKPTQRSTPPKEPGSFPESLTLLEKRKDDMLAPKSSAGTATMLAGKTKIQIKLPISVGALATNMEVKTSELIKALMTDGIFANVNQLLNEEITRKITSKFGVTLEILPSHEEEIISHHDEEDPASMEPRPPVVTFMGHVDHGKTSLLDAVRNSRIVEKEAGRITQHIGAYSVHIEGKGDVTFLDTPGHEAFTAMRTRGANVTDIVVLVVAADDGVMPQTVEAINHAKAASVPIVVAVNKVDLPDANPDRVKAELQKFDLVSEDWGGKTIMVNVSALKRTGIQELLEMLLLEAEILELKANPKKSSQGVVLEAKITKSHGTVTNALVTSGTLKIGDYVICGSCFGKVRAMHDDRGKNIKSAGPSKPVEIFGMQGVPNAADRFFVVEDEKTAKKIADQKALEEREKSLSAKLVRHTTLESLFEKVNEGKLQELKIIIKADVQGSLEVLQQSLEKISSSKINLRIIHAAVGGINESDVMLAAVSDAIVIGFHVKAGMKAQEIIDREGIDVRYYNIIYEAIDDVKVAMEGKLAPTYKEVSASLLDVRETFQASRIGTIAGCYVMKGKISRQHQIRVIRDDIVIHEGTLSSLKRFKDDMREVKEGLECGLTISNFNNLQKGDRVESYYQEAIATKL